MSTAIGLVKPSRWGPQATVSETDPPHCVFRMLKSYDRRTATAKTTTRKPTTDSLRAPEVGDSVTDCHARSESPCAGFGQDFRFVVLAVITNPDCLSRRFFFARAADRFLNLRRSLQPLSGFSLILICPSRANSPPNRGRDIISSRRARSKPISPPIGREWSCCAIMFQSPPRSNIGRRCVRWRIHSGNRF